MNKAQKALLIGLSASVLLCGCQKEAGSDTPISGTETPGTVDSSLESATRIAYYEELVATMERQMLELKTQLYTSRAEYNALYAIYCASQDGGDSVSEKTVSFSYIKEGDHVVITAYLGKDTAVIIPASIDGLPVRSIADNAFAYQTAITSVLIPEGVESIGWFAFSGCVSLKEVTMPKSVASISYGAFENCNSTLTVICTPGSYAEQYAQSYGYKTQH